MIEDINVGAVLWGLMVFGLFLSLFIVVIGISILVISIIEGFGLGSLILGLLFIMAGTGGTITLYLWFTEGVE